MKPDVSWVEELKEKIKERRDVATLAGLESVLPGSSLEWALVFSPNNVDCLVIADSTGEIVLEEHEGRPTSYQARHMALNDPRLVLAEVGFHWDLVEAHHFLESRNEWCDCGGWCAACSCDPCGDCHEAWPCTWLVRLAGVYGVVVPSGRSDTDGEASDDDTERDA